MEDKETMQFDRCLYGVGEKLNRILLFIEDNTKREIQEIRLRAEKPLSITLRGESFFVEQNSSVSKNADRAYRVTQKDIFESYKNLTQNSVYSHLKEIKQGYIAMRYGCRAGIAGAYSEEGGITHISSVNIRISREKTGVADRLFNEYSSGGVLIAGKAGSGKTTLLRDFIRQLSDSGKRVAAVDSRGELSATYMGISYNDLGVNTDVLYGFEKDKGIEIALRTLYPNIIAFDEIGRAEEIEKIRDCLYGGADIITTAHLGSTQEINKREIIRELLQTGAIQTVVCLSDIAGEGYEIIGEVKKLCGE
ncbi:MAG: type IV secretion system DNA-binding domain-containing protein [Acutalibacteraceae bacterium]|nr:type IV secretion system DNA-binding domain-containing protein [Acutalibacteraceae bacterium]